MFAQTRRLVPALLVVLVLAANAAYAGVGSTFTFQGQLSDGGTPASGTVHLKFWIYDTDFGGSPLAPSVDLPMVDVIDGYFTVELDFGFIFAGATRWLEVVVDGTTLSPRQPIRPVPYAMYALDGASPTSPWTHNGSSIYYSGGDVAIGTNTPTSPLHVTRASGESVRIENDGTVGFGDGIALVIDGASAYGLNLTSTATTGVAVGAVIVTEAPESHGIFVRHDATTGTGEAIEAEQYSTTDGATAVLGRINSTTPGFGSAAVRGENLGGTGFHGAGVWGTHAGSGRGVVGQSVDGNGVEGIVSGPLNDGVAIYGSTASANGYASYFQAAPGSWAGYFVGDKSYFSGQVGIGTTTPTAALDVYDVSGGAIVATSINSEAILASTDDGIGVYTRAVNDNFFTYALYAEADGQNAHAGWFDGRVHVDGELTKTSGTFKIDHPQDPENRYLYHSFVESPDRMNIYDGLATFDERGDAWVELPAYFEALNRDFRYQLTCIGGFAPVYVAERIESNRFLIAGGTPGVEVSWQVTGVRRDAYAEAHPIVTEVDKPEALRGTYLNPEVHGQPADRSEHARALAARESSRP